MHQTRAFRMVQPGRTIVLPWGRGGGKTYFGRATIHSLALSKPTSLGLLYPSLKQARAVIWEGADALFSDFEMLRRAGIVRRYHRGELYAEYANGSRLSTWGAENAHAIRGQRFGCIISDETDEIEPELERSVVQPTFSRSGTSAIYIKLGTPRRGRHGSLYASFEQVQEQAKGVFLQPDGKRVHDPTRPRRFYGFRLRSADSPQVDQTWLSEVRSDLYAKGKGPTYEREYECNFDAAEGLVYPTFNQDFHVRPPPHEVPWSEILVGVDHGWNDPGVILVLGVLGNGRDAMVYVIEETYETAKDTTWWEERAAEVAWRYRYWPQRWFADPSRPDRIVDLRRAVTQAHPELSDSFAIREGENSIEAGVDAVADRLAIRDSEMGKRARLYLAPGCANTIAEFGKYRRKRDPKNTETILDDIVDKDNHAMDALRYAIFTRFGGPDRVRREQTY